ncbi:hypothetical protein D9M68_510110 [compost metagenome]
MPLRALLFSGLGHVRDKARARHFAGAEAGQVRGVLLAVDHCDAAAPAQRDQAGQRDLRGVRTAREHRFAEYGPAQRHAVEPARQLAVDPGFDAVGVPGAVQLRIGLHHVRHDPGARLAGARRLRTRLDHRSKIVIDAQLAAGRRGKTAQRLAQRAMQPEIAHPQHHARVGAPPQDGLVVAEPGEDAAAVGLHQSIDIEGAAGRQQAGHRVPFVPRRSGVGQCISGFEPRQLSHGCRYTRLLGTAAI